MAPAGTPKPVIERLNAEVRRIVAMPEVREAWAKQGVETMSMSVDGFSQFLREDITKWAGVVKRSGAKVD
jgi:tripartite-type tricarboxylate transporter receptor subunit TctC